MEIFPYQLFCPLWTFYSLRKGDVDVDGTVVGDDLFAMYGVAIDREGVGLRDEDEVDSSAAYECVSRCGSTRLCDHCAVLEAERARDGVVSVGLNAAVEVAREEYGDIVTLGNKLKGALRLSLSDSARCNVKVGVNVHKLLTRYLVLKDNVGNYSNVLRAIHSASRYVGSIAEPLSTAVDEVKLILSVKDGATLAFFVTVASVAYPIVHLAEGLVLFETADPSVASFLRADRIRAAVDKKLHNVRVSCAADTALDVKGHNAQRLVDLYGSSSSLGSGFCGGVFRGCGCGSCCGRSCVSVIAAVASAKHKKHCKNE